MTFAEFNEKTGFEAKAGFQLTPLQVTDVEQFVQWRKSLNRYTVGCGKTVLSTVVSLMSDVETTIVCMPPILLASWEEWLNRVSEKVVRYQGSPTERKKMALKGQRWVVMSHAILRIDFERLMKTFEGVDLEVIIDEAQAIKNPKAKLYTCIGLMSRNRRLQMLTGTPTSKPLDCYTYIRLKSPDLYRSYAHFEHTHIAEKDFFGSVTAYQNLDILAENFALKSILRTKQEVHGYSLVPIVPDCLYELSPEHYKLYEQLMEEQLLLLDDGSKIDATSATRLFHAAQQIVCNFDYFSGDANLRSNIYDLVDLTIEQTECLDPSKSKLIIWTIYKMTSRAMLKYLKTKGVHAVGAYSEVDSKKNFETFIKDPSCRVLVANYQSAGAGLNPQTVCSESLHVETPTSSMLMTQAIGRLDRVGQTVAPTMRIAIAKGTIQEARLEKLIDNDLLVGKVERTTEGLRKILFGKVK